MTARDQIIGGGPELDALLRTLPDRMQKNINRAALRAGAAVFLKEVKQNIPVKSGNLRKTARISGKIKNGEAVVSVKVGGKHKGADGWYAHLVEYGTRPHKITANQKDGALHFGNQTIKSVEHSGSRARPFMRPAVDAKFTEAINAVREKIRERLAHNGLNVPDPTPAGDE